MPRAVLRPREPAPAELLETFAAIRVQQHVPAAFPPDVQAAAAEAASRSFVPGDGRRDHRDLPLVTIDPPGALDLDQALHLERRGDGWRVWYAIADVGAFVTDGDPVDGEARERGTTRYSPDRRTPLHPDVLGEGAASLLPDVDRPALVWRIDLDGTGAVVGDTVVERGFVRSRARLDYPGVQAALDAGTADEVLVLLREVGQARRALEVARGGVSLDLPEQVVEHEDGTYRLAYRAPLPCEGWNAQLSLLTGMEAARIMVAGGVGLLRTLPAPDPTVVAAVRRSACSLGIDCTPDAPYTEIVRASDPATPAGAALLHQAVRALRGSGYLAFDRTTGVPADHGHSAVAAAYAHVTAPLRRLADRFANEVVLALAAGVPVSDDVLAALPTLPKLMGAATERERALSRAIIDAVEALVLRHRVGETFTATVTNVDARGGVVQLTDPAVLVHLPGPTEADLGRAVPVRLDAVDVDKREVRFSLVDSS